MSSMDEIYTTKWRNFLLKDNFSRIASRLKITSWLIGLLYSKDIITTEDKEILENPFFTTAEKKQKLLDMLGNVPEKIHTLIDILNDDELLLKPVANILKEFCVTNPQPAQGPSSAPSGLRGCSEERSMEAATYEKVTVDSILTVGSSATHDEVSVSKNPGLKTSQLLDLQVAPTKNVTSSNLSQLAEEHDKDGEPGRFSAGIVAGKLKAGNDVTVNTDSRTNIFTVNNYVSAGASIPPTPTAPVLLKDILDEPSKNHTPSSRTTKLVQPGAETLASLVTDLSLPPEGSEISDTDYATDSSEFMDYLEQSESEKALLSPRSKPIPIPEQQSLPTDAHFSPTVLHAEGENYRPPKYLVRFASNSEATSVSCIPMRSVTHAYVCFGSFAREIRFGSEEETVLLGKDKITFNLAQHRCNESLEEYFIKQNQANLQSLTLIGPLPYEDIRQILKFLQHSIRHLHFIDVKTSFSIANGLKRPLGLKLFSFTVSFNDRENRLVRCKLNKLITPLLRFWQSEKTTVFETLVGIRAKNAVNFEIVFNGIRVVKYTAGGELTLCTNHGYKIKTQKVMKNVSEHLTHLSCYYLQWKPLAFKFDRTSFSSIRYINLNSCKINNEGQTYETIFFHSFVNLETLILDGCKLGLNLRELRQADSSKLKDVVLCNEALTFPEDEASFLQLCSSPVQRITLCNCYFEEYPSYLSNVSTTKESLLIELTPGNFKVRNFLWNYFPWKQPQKLGVTEEEWVTGVASDKEYYFELVKASDFSISRDETIFVDYS